MGVPYLYRSLINKYPHMRDALKVFLAENKNIHLYIDFNAIIHPIVGKIIDECLKTGKKVNREEFNQKAYNGVRLEVLKVIDMVKPVFVMISTDGVCPRAKMEQQRRRRYSSVLKGKRRRVFDTNAISPGTFFMKGLTRFMKKFVDDELSQRLRVFYSPDSKAGEGEHKIISEINKNKDKDITNVIWGLDADLVLLSLTTNLHNIYLLREKQEFEQKEEESVEEKKTAKTEDDEIKSSFTCLSIKKLREHFWEDAMQKNEKITEILTEEQFFRDFIFLSYFLGNDFLPHIKVISIYHNGYQELVGEYIKYVVKYGKGILSNDYIINQNLLLDVLRKFYTEEKEYIRKNNRKGKDKLIKYNTDGWRDRYYDYYLKSTSKVAIKKMCFNYWKMVVWNTEYYFTNKCCWGEYYRYLNSPTFKDLYEMLETIDLNSITFKYMRPYKPMQQLMVIFPPHSRFLVPRKLHWIYEKHSKMYPMRFQFDKVDKYVAWQWIPILPLVDDRVILRNVF